MVLIYSDGNDIIGFNSKFPSPYGDYGSYPDDLGCIGQDASWFPSPYGDYGSYLRKGGIEYEKIYVEVSVPLRGLWFLSATA